MWHINAMNMGPHMPMGAYPHQGPIFLPWHRSYILRMEKALGVPLPYWDWAADSAFPNSKNLDFWSETLMGGDGDPNDHYYVKAGPFANWPVTEGMVDTNAVTHNIGRKLSRRLGMDAPTLPSQSDVDTVLTKVPYDMPPWDNTTLGFRNRFEGWVPNGPQLHDLVHVWVGGTMGLMSSPNDPCFFLHHSNVDRIWMQWQKNHPDHDYPESGSIVDTQGMPLDGQNRNDLLHPWNDAKVEGVLNATQLGYTYDTLA